MTIASEPEKPVPAAPGDRGRFLAVPAVNGVPELNRIAPTRLQIG
jgi:hypothetical protein